jgi:hypothetical protein
MLLKKVRRELQGRVNRQKRATDKARAAEKAKKMLAQDKGRAKSKLSAKDYALLSRDLRRRVLREMPERVEVVA